MSTSDCSHGPVSSLPGAKFQPEPDSTCDRHPDVQAVKKVQGETDSFGCEYVHMCQACVDANEAYTKEQLSVEKFCDWCSGMKLNVRAHRDFEEGQSGRVYQVCSDCRARESESVAEELVEYESESRYSNHSTFDDDGGY
jgi:hypothetical protein